MMFRLAIILFLLINIDLTSTAQQTPYFQQRVEYDISVKLDTKTNSISGEEKIRYYNNSLDTLTYICIHIYPNAYKDNNSAFAKQEIENNKLSFYFAKEEDRGFISNLDFKTNNTKAKWSYDPQYQDICRVYLTEPLAPGKYVDISTPFFVKIPSNSFSRMGYDGKAYQLTQWYPKPAVYDINGWHPIPYTNIGEFFGEYGSYKVSITLPSNYVVAATGRLETESERHFLDSIALLTSEKLNSETLRYSDTQIYSTLTSNNSINTQPSHNWKTITYKQDSIHDFAWLANMNFNVLKDTVILPKSKRSIETWIFFTNSNIEAWKDANKYLKDATRYFSKEIGEYPYSSISAVQAPESFAGGMEYPMLVSIADETDPLFLEMVIAHEACHNWFYGILGSNERDNPWLDEGLTTYYEWQYSLNKYPDKAFMLDYLESFTKAPDQYLHKIEKQIFYLLQARKHLDQPVNLHSWQYNELNYGGLVYEHTAGLLNYLKSYIGKASLDSAIQEYYKDWSFKHPSPKDFKDIVTKNTNKNLDWFFEGQISKSAHIDYKIKHISLNPGSNDVSLTLINKTGTNAPFTISSLRNNKIIKTKWVEGFSNRRQTINLPLDSAERFEIDATYDIPELYRSNNSINTKGLFKKSNPIRLQFGAGLEPQHRQEIYYLPLLGWNEYNHLMPGIALYNSSFLRKDFEYIVAPMYSNSSKMITGYAQVQQHFYLPNYNSITLGGDLSRFSYSDAPILNYLRIAPSLTLSINKTPKSTLKKEISFRYIFMNKDSARYSRILNEYVPFTTNARYANIDLCVSEERKLNPYSIQIRLEPNEKFGKLSAEYRHKFNYTERKALNIRVFAGAFIYQSDEYYGNYNFRLNGQHGYQDYMMDNIYLGRNERNGILSQQFVENEGGFKKSTYVGENHHWMVTANICTSLPGKLPFSIYADLGTYERAGKLFTGSRVIAWDLGIKVKVIPEILEIYLPIDMSSDIRQVSELRNETYLQKIRYTLYLDKLNLIKAMRELKFPL